MHHKNNKPVGNNNNNGSPRSQETVPTTPSPNVFMDRFKNKKKFDYAEFDDDDNDIEKDGSLDLEHNDPVISPLTTNKGDFATTTATIPQFSVMNNTTRQPDDIKFTQYPNISFDDSSVSDVSAHILGAKGTLKHVDANTASVDDPNASQAESFLLDTTMDSYNMDAMSALGFGRFENVLQVSSDGPPPSYYNIARHDATTTNTYEDAAIGEGEDEDGSHSVPSELYSNLSMDSSMMNASQDTSGAVYGGHLFTSMDMMMLKNKDTSLLEMPPPPSDAASDSSSRPDDIAGEDNDDGQILPSDDQPPLVPSPVPAALHLVPPTSVSGIENAPLRQKSMQDAVSQSITEELSKVMKLLEGENTAAEAVNDNLGVVGGSQDAEQRAEPNDVARESSIPSNEDSSIVHIGNVKVADASPVAVDKQEVDKNDGEDETELAPTPEPDYNEGVNVLMIDDVSTDVEPDETNPMKQVNNALNDCMDILERAKASRSSTPYVNNDNTEGNDDTPEAKEAMAGEVSKSNEVAGEDELSLVTERLD